MPKWCVFSLPRALFGHWDNNPNVIYHISSGTGGAEELAQQVDKAQYQYALGEPSCDSHTHTHILFISNVVCVVLGALVRCVGVVVEASFWSRSHE